jgi:hypothetical protein
LWREGAPDGPVIGRIYKVSFLPSGTPWFWRLLIFPAIADSGAAETLEPAMAAVKAQWLKARVLSKAHSGGFCFPLQPKTIRTSTGV